MLPAAVAPGIQQLLRRCLEKNPKRRWYAAGDVRLELETIIAEPWAVIAQERAPARRPLWRRAIPVVLGAVVAAAIAASAAWYQKPSGARTITRFPILLQEGQRFTNTGRLLLAISPDRTQMAYVANNRLYLRSMADLEAPPIPGTDSLGNVTNPAFSPDGRSVAFYAGSGRGKADMSNRPNRPLKQVLAYPLDKCFRRLLEAS